MAAYWVERLLLGKPHAHLVLTGVVMVGLIAVNPYGLSYYPYILHAILMPRPDIREWYPIWAGLEMLGILIVINALRQFLQIPSRGFILLSIFLEKGTSFIEKGR